jgi:hypothetical protein
VLPTPTVWVAGVAVKPKSAAGGGVVAVPVNALVCGEPAALSLTLSVAESLPAAVGSNVTEMLHEAPAAREVPQLFDDVKAAVFAPVRVIPEIVSAALPVLLSVADCAALFVPATIEPKSSFAGVSVAAGAVAAAPSPLRVLDCGEPFALSATLRIACDVPVEVGEKVTAMVQEAPAATELPQVFEAMANSAALAPPREMEVTESAAVPLLVRVKVCAALVEPMAKLPK